MEGGSNGHHSYETDFSVRYLPGALVVVDVAAVHLLFVLVLVFVDLAVLALHGPLALALEHGLDRPDGPKWLVVDGELVRLDLGRR